MDTVALGGTEIEALADAAEEAGKSAATVRVVIGGTAADVPAAVAVEIAGLLRDVGGGTSVVAAPFDLPVGTEAAANLLGVSRPWLTTLLDRGVIPMQRNGSKRRVRLGDLIAYRRAESRRNAQHFSPVAAGQIEAAQEVSQAGRSTVRWRSSTPPPGWSDFSGPTAGVVELPFHLYWSDDNNAFDLSKRARLRSMYQVVLAEGSAQDVCSYINFALLIDVWSELWLSPAVHEAWDNWIEEHRHAAV